MRSGRPALAVALASGCAALLAGCGGHGSGTPSLSAVPVTPSGPAIDVTRYGARGDGQTDNTQAFAAAIGAAQATGGGTVYVPAGRYAFGASHTQGSGSVTISGTAPVTLQGAGRDLTTLVETRHDKPLLTVKTDHSVVEDLTLDTQTDDGGAAIRVVANHTQLLHARVLGGPGHFALYYVGPKGASPATPAYNVDNSVGDLQLNDLDCNDGFSWSFQKDGTISDVVHTGSRLALYMDQTVTVTNYHYTPGAQLCGARNAFWLTPPAENITITNFVSSGQGGKVGVISSAHAGRVAVNVTIKGLTLTDTGQQLTIGDVRNLVLQGCNLSGNDIVVDPQVVAQGAISDCHYARLVKSGAPGAQISIAGASA